jgi:ABC-type Fe3+/spermidine/putrescine transport system ATPase subunit
MNNSLQPAVEVHGLAKHYGSVVALKRIDLTIGAGEYFVLLGPSGGGKTTLLRTIGGFNKPTHGQVLLHGQDVIHVPPDRRPTSMVFQSYALFPHMNVMGNVGYGLKIAGKAKDAIREKTTAALELVGLSGFGERKPHELSGGQQQRVQLARAMVLDRDILLLDEPLAALDAQLRKDMCLELKHLQEKVGITFIHVTHNQEEAMTVADRIALIANGELVEHGAARDIYRAPVRRFTASFVGENNVLSAVVIDTDDKTSTVETNGQQLRVKNRGLKPKISDKVDLSIRSELVTMTIGKPPRKIKPGYSLTGKYHESVYLGLTTSHRVGIFEDCEIVAREISDNVSSVPKPDESVVLSWPTDAMRLHIN